MSGHDARTAVGPPQNELVDQEGDPGAGAGQTAQAKLDPRGLGVDADPPACRAGGGKEDSDVGGAVSDSDGDAVVADPAPSLPVGRVNDQLDGHASTMVSRLPPPGVVVPQAGHVMGGRE
ncbi:hypothetical protein OG906_34005 [Streptomyces sp. NBC_01426]|uniref:hypothetical protein n=1 Tax=Streptomyces sp. NBC_01426 TaxID=2975866 RepID=UPI002E32E1F3|nr:hypothetical protein [Streptomyces sp. NBC_01426]